MAESSAQRITSAVPVVAAQGLTKVFRDFWMRPHVRAVDGLDLQIENGEIFGLLGPNGSGKSTTIKLMLGLLHKTGGRLAVFGKDPTDVGIKRRLGVLPEESYLYPFLNATETLDYYGKLFQLDYKIRRRRITELLDMVGLTAVQHRQIKEYSKGMQRRIGIAQALINDPEFLILDEPTTGLDPIGSRQIKDLIISLGRRGKTILLSSHQLSDVEDCVDRMAILYGGKKRAEGTCDDLLTARSRMTIETGALDEETISQIDRLIQQRTGGAIARVSKPRQRLEDLFVDIVADAQKDRLQTGGATHGGATAAFLLGTGDGAATKAEGEELIDQLMSSAALEHADGDTTHHEAATRSAADSSSFEPTGPDESVIDLLVTEDPEPVRPAPVAKAPSTDSARPKPRAADVDQSMIDSLLGDGAKESDKS